MARSKAGYQQLTVYLEKAIHQAFKKMSVDQEFNMSDWVAERVEKAVIEAGFYEPYSKPINDYANLAEVVRERRRVLERKSRISREVLQLMAAGERPTEVDLLRLGMALELKHEELESLVERSFPDEQKTQKA